MVSTRSQDTKNEGHSDSESGQKDGGTNPHYTARPKAPTSGRATKTSPSGLPKLDNKTLDNPLRTHGTMPLSFLNLEAPQEPNPETILAHLLYALLSSARISHDIAATTLKCLIEAGYHDIKALSQSTWQRRTEILTEGGYT